MDNGNVKDTPSVIPARSLNPTPAAERALAEAEARRREAAPAPTAPGEVNGRGGLDPARFGDWEVNGIACDF